jgi:Rab-GTPase-TBC domain
LSFFDKTKYGDIGQKGLMNILAIYSLYHTKVGYCQSMNFVIGFMLLISGGNERESFWLFASLAKSSNIEEGIEGFYTKNFPLLE